MSLARNTSSGRFSLFDKTSSAFFCLSDRYDLYMNCPYSSLINVLSLVWNVSGVSSLVSLCSDRADFEGVPRRNGLRTTGKSLSDLSTFPKETKLAPKYFKSFSTSDPFVAVLLNFELCRSFNVSIIFEGTDLSFNMSSSIIVTISSATWYIGVADIKTNRTFFAKVMTCFKKLICFSFSLSSSLSSSLSPKNFSFLFDRMP